MRLLQACEEGRAPAAEWRRQRHGALLFGQASSSFGTVSGFRKMVPNACIYSPLAMVGAPAQLVAQGRRRFYLWREDGLVLALRGAC